MIKKLYDKNELWIAIPFIILWCISNISLRVEYGDDSIYLMVANIVITLLTILFIGKYKLWEKYGLNKLPKNSKKYLYFFPMIILGTVNFWGGFKCEYIGISLIYASITMILIGYIEEIIFRGFLFKAVEKNKGITSAIIISAITFGIGHIINLFVEPSFDTIMQVIYAIALGFVFVYTFHKSKSLWPSIILHSVIDFTSKYGNHDNINLGIITVIVTVICILYVVYLRKIND